MWCSKKICLREECSYEKISKSNRSHHGSSPGSHRLQLRRGKDQRSGTEAAKTEAAGDAAKTEAAKDAASGDEEPVLVVYTARSEALNNAVIPEFEKDTGIKVEVVVAGTGELLKRAQSEKDNPLGDIFWVADQTMLSASKDLFMEYVSPEDENMLDAFRNTTGYFTPAFADPTVMIVN